MSLQALSDEDLLDDIRSMEQAIEQYKAEIKRRVLARAIAAGERCRMKIRNTVPSWAGEDQIDPCSCVRPAGHQGVHLCAHEAPDDMVPEPSVSERH